MRLGELQAAHELSALRGKADGALMQVRRHPTSRPYHLYIEQTSRPLRA